MSEGKRLRELDAMRGIAVLMVVVFHTTFLHGPVFKWGATGVELFFMISGFVIFMSLNHVESGRQFIVNRFARLYPIYWVCLTLTFVAHLARGPLSGALVTRYLLSLTMLQQYLGVKEVDGLYWSLAVELAFYAVMYAIYRLKQLHRAEWILLAIVLAELGLEVKRHIQNGPDLTTSWEPYVQLVYFLPLFLAGIFFYRIYSAGASVLRYAMVAVCFAAQVMEYPNRNIAMLDLQVSSYMTILGIYFVLFILFVNGWAGFIVSKAMLFAGRISYALYLFHRYVIVYVLLPMLNDTVHPSFPVSCVIAIATVIVIAALNTLLIDEPVRKMIKRRLGRSAETARRAAIEER